MSDTTGLRLRKWRYSKNFTLNQVGKMVGVHASTIARLELGESLPKIETAREIEKLSGIKVGSWK